MVFNNCIFHYITSYLALNKLCSIACVQYTHACSNTHTNPQNTHIHIHTHKCTHLDDHSYNVKFYFFIIDLKNELKIVFKILNTHQFLPRIIIPIGNIQIPFHHTFNSTKYFFNINIYSLNKYKLDYQFNYLRFRFLVFLLSISSVYFVLSFANFSIMFICFNWISIHDKKIKPLFSFLLLMLLQHIDILGFLCCCWFYAIQIYQYFPYDFFLHFCVLCKSFLS